MALASDAPPRYSRPARGSAVDDFEAAIRGLLAEFPAMPATVIAEECRSATLCADLQRIVSDQEAI